MNAPDWFACAYRNFCCAQCGRFREAHMTERHNHPRLCDACVEWWALSLWKRIVIAFFFALWALVRGVPSGKGWRQPLSKLPIWKPPEGIQ